MSGPDVEQTAEPGERLSEEARTAIYDAMRGVKGPTEHALNMTEAHRVLAAIDPVVAALVAAAEERGAAKERERCELWLRDLADRAKESVNPELAADLRWAANRMAEELGGKS